MNSCYIIGANCDRVSITKKAGDFVIAADGGYLAAQNSGILPDLVLGDFDSLGYTPKGCDVISLPVRKDDTDTVYAVKQGLLKGYKSFYIYGGLGGRTDHTVANLQTLQLIAQNGGRGYLVSQDEVLTVINNSSISFKENSSGTVSVFAFGGVALGVSIKGLLYELECVDLTPSFPLGVSNSFKGEEARIEVKKGSILVVFGKTDYIIN